jgi:hypothetical protein
MQSPNTYTYTMTLTLSVTHLCEGAINAPGVTLSSDWATASGDSSFSYDQIPNFVCPGLALAPSYTITQSPTDSRFSDNPATKTVNWVISSFTADLTIKQTVVGALQYPHT